MRKIIVRVVAILALLMVAIFATSIVARATGYTQFDLLTNNVAQQGAVTVSGACQNGEELTLAFGNEWDPTYANGAGAFVVTSLTVWGINSSCTDMAVVVNGGTPAWSAATDGTAVPVDPAIPAGNIDSINVLLLHSGT